MARDLLHYAALGMPVAAAFAVRDTVRLGDRGVREAGTIRAVLAELVPVIRQAVAEQWPDSLLLFVVTESRKGHPVTMIDKPPIL
jgi:hypothetical protein